MTVSVIIGTYGDPDKWGTLAQRAIASAENQTLPAEEVIHIHGKTLAQARNQGAEQATSEWLIFLDADDELDSGYVRAMTEANGDLRRPSTLGIVNGKPDNASVMIPRHRLLDSNFIVIGAMHRKADFHAVGGFEEFPMFEDWALWLALWINGADITDVFSAIYRVHVNPDSRNMDAALGIRVYNQIKSRYTAEARAKGII